MIFLPDAEKTGEEKDKEKEKREETPAATEATDAKDKSEAADMKKGTFHSLKSLKKQLFFTIWCLCCLSQ